MNRKEILTVALVLSALILAIFFSSCTVKDHNPEMPVRWVWMNAGDRTEKEWLTLFRQLKKEGIEGVLLRASEEDYRKIIPLAEKRGVDIHAWIITLNRAWDDEAKNHPEWFTISRDGKSCYDVHPYVGYYWWVCPSREDVYRHVENEVLSLLSIEGLKGVHLDYVRYSDVILPVGLWSKYNIVQDKEYAEYDFCYCDTCRKKFFEESGRDISDLTDASADTAWREYRWNSVTMFVNRLAERVHTEYPGKMLTAAVFPYPELSRSICRQDWEKWDLDAFFPMIYHSFYNEDTEWIGYATGEGVRDLEGKAPLFTGLFLPALSPEDLQKAIDVSLENGAAGISLFDYGSLKDTHRSILRKRR